MSDVIIARLDAMEASLPEVNEGHLDDSAGIVAFFTDEVLAFFPDALDQIQQRVAIWQVEWPRLRITIAEHTEDRRVRVLVKRRATEEPGAYCGTRKRSDNRSTDRRQGPIIK